MPTELDILAIEPFHGGERRAMLETVVEHSRHRWNILKLPARRLERRLAMSSIWFAEVINRRPIGNVDIVFATEILNLADLYRLAPWLERKPAVVYFHANQLPEPMSPPSGAIDLVNLNSAIVASEIWFNSQFHYKSFIAKASALARKHADMLGRNPTSDLVAKAHVMQPPVDLELVQGLANTESPERRPRQFIVETLGADVALLTSAMMILRGQRPDFEVITIGPATGLPDSVSVRCVDERDEIGSARALLEAGVYVSARPGATSDRHAVRALAAGCWAILPDFGVYPELLPEGLHKLCLYENSAQALASKVLDAWSQPLPTGFEQQQARILFQFDPDYACREMDDRFEELALVNSM